MNQYGKLKKEQHRLGSYFPKFGIFIVTYNAQEHLEQLFADIPTELIPFIDEIFIFDDCSQDETIKVANNIKQSSPYQDKISIHCNSKNLGYGGNQKQGYAYAIEQKLDYVILLHGDKQYNPKFIVDLMLPVLAKNQDVVFGSRMINKLNALKGNMPIYKWVGNQVVSKIQNLILGMNLSEFHCGMRLYSTQVLKQINLAKNSNDFDFDTQIIIQLKANNIDIHEVPIETFYGQEVCHVNGLKYVSKILSHTLYYKMSCFNLITKPDYIKQ